MQIPVNTPYTTRVSTDQRDGQMCVNGNNSPTAAYSAPENEIVPQETSSLHFAHNLKLSGVNRHVSHSTADDYIQPGVFWRNVLTIDERKRLANRMILSLMHVKKPIADRMIGLVKLADEQWGKWLEEGVALKASV